MPISFGGLLCLLATGSGQQEARGGTPGVQHGEALQHAPLAVLHPCPPSRGDTPTIVSPLVPRREIKAQMQGLAELGCLSAFFWEPKKQ